MTESTGGIDMDEGQLLTVNTPNLLRVFEELPDLYTAIVRFAIRLRGVAGEALVSRRR